MYGRNASVGPYASPGEASDDYMGVEGKDYRWKHIITVYDSQGNVKEAWTQWDSLFKPDNPNVFSQGRVHKILINPYDPEKRVWAIDDGHEVIRIFSNDGKKLLQTIGTLNTTTERNAKMTGNTGRPSYIQKTGPASETFGRQTDIAWLPDGTFFVTDGYEETRVVKFDKNGKFLMAWGERGEAGRQREAARTTSIPCTASPLTTSAGSTSTTAATGASRSSMRTANSSTSGISATGPPRRITSS